MQNTLNITECIQITKESGFSEFARCAIFEIESIAEELKTKQDRINELETTLKNILINLESGDFYIVNAENGERGNLDGVREILYK